MNELRKAVVFGIVLCGLGSCAPAKKAPPPPPPNVLVSPVTRQNVSIYIEAVGTLDGYVNADIRARVKGYLKTQDYKDGATVKEGQLLFTIDPAEYIAAESAARATLARAVAAQTNARATLDRNQGLHTAGILSAQDLQNSVAANADTNAQVLAAQAGVQQADLNLSYTKIKAPNAGIAGLALVRVGNLVGQDTPTLLTTVSLVDPIRMNFAMAETDYVRFPERLKRLDGRDLEWAKKQFPKLDAHQAADGGDSGVDLLLADGTVYPHRGLIVTANRQIDSSTGTIQIQALFPNTDSVLRPGQYGRVRIRREGEGDAVLVIPEKALISVQGAYSVAVVGPDNKVALRRVSLGASVRGFRIVTDGVKEGDNIVVEGSQKIADGATVATKLAPPDAPASADALPSSSAAPTVAVTAAMPASSAPTTSGKP